MYSDASLVRRRKEIKNINLPCHTVLVGKSALLASLDRIEGLVANSTPRELELPLPIRLRIQGSGLGLTPLSTLIASSTEVQ